MRPYLSYETQVLELGCGHGLPGVFAALAGASEVGFADFNAEVLTHLTAPNLLANLARLPPGNPSPSAPPFPTNSAKITVMRK
jgi:predicted nicotinamide N-methyase